MPRVVRRRATQSREAEPVVVEESSRPFSFSMQNPLTSLGFLIIGLIIGGVVGMLVTKVQYLEKGMTTAQAPNTQPAGAGTQAGGPTAVPQKQNVSVGHFPVKGDENAKVTIVEFADFRCPFCEKLFTDTIPQIQKDYVDTGKAKFAFRQYAFLGPASTTAANAAECAN